MDPVVIITIISTIIIIIIIIINIITVFPTSFSQSLFFCCDCSRVTSVLINRRFNSSLSRVDD
jgi:hypothetical protein